MAERDSSGGREADTGEVVFYYSREHRLNRASPAVKALYDDAPGPGVIKSLAGRRSNLFLLVAILMVCVMFVLASRIPGNEKGVALGGNTVSSVITRNDKGKLSISIQKTGASSDGAYTGAVAVVVSPMISKQDKGKTPEIYTDKFFFTPAEKENYLFELPFEGKDFLVILQTENERKGLRIKVKKTRN
jgi:hypothetical protein